MPLSETASDILKSSVSVRFSLLKVEVLCVKVSLSGKECYSPLKIIFQKKPLCVFILKKKRSSRKLYAVVLLNIFKSEVERLSWNLFLKHLFS